MTTDMNNSENKEIKNELIKADNEIKEVLEDSGKLHELTRGIDITNTDTILSYGQDTAVEISKFADRVLHEMQLTKIEESSELMKRLNEIMEEFDLEDFKEEKQGFLSKIFGSAKDSIEKIFGKYQTMGSKVDVVHQELKVYENQIKESNKVLEEMFDNNMDYYQDLQLHISAAKLYLDKIKNNDLVELDKKAAETGEQIDTLNANNMRQAIQILDQRVYDLELAKNVSLQALPQIKLIQRGNYDLMRKINSAFIVTLPIFKQGLTQAIALKRQKIQAEAMAELDKRTNELILKNAENTASQSVLTAQLASGSGIELETLQQSWETIIRGIEETRALQEEAAIKREEGSKLLAVIQEEYKEKMKEV